MKTFEILGRRIEQAWAAEGFELGSFPEIAEQYVRNTDLSGIDIDEICQWVLKAPSFPEQINFNSSFGQPPLTVFSCERFYMEVLFWLSATTAVHEHNFSGLFFVLSGSSIQSEFKFIEEHRTNDHLLFGRMKQQNIELLRQGDYRRIYSGPSFIHSLFHLDHPSVSLVIRTYNDFGRKIQYEYFKPHIAIDSFFSDQLATRQFQLLRMMKLSHNPRFALCLSDFLEKASLHAIVQVTLLLANDNLLNGDEIQIIIGTLEKAYRELSGYIKPVFSEIDRMNAIRVGRFAVTDIDHRFFMALLMNADTRENVDRLIMQKYKQSPVELLKEWIRDLNSGGRFNPKLKEFDLDLLSVMVGTRSFSEAMEKLGHVYEKAELDVRNDEIKDSYKWLRGLPLFSVLFTGINES